MTHRIHGFSIRQTTGRRVLLATALAAGACRDSTPARPRTALAAPAAVEAQLLLSSLRPQQGQEVEARLRINTGAGVRPVGSFTATIVYDSTALTFLAEDPATSGGMRVVNPLAGAARVAGISSAGFEDGSLVTLHFTARRAASLQDANATISELHSVDRVDLLARVASRRVSAQLLGR